METDPTSSIQEAAVRRTAIPNALPARRVLRYLHWVGQAKRILLFLLLYGLFAYVCSMRMDVRTGAQTLSWLQQAHENVGLKPLDQLDNVQQVASLMEDGVATVVGELETICSQCAVGLTTSKVDLRFLGLESFICSDFISSVGSEHYPPRDCVTADSAWARDPSADSAPCCKNVLSLSLTLTQQPQPSPAVRTLRTAGCASSR
jgi:hypothetical protein